MTQIIFVLGFFTFWIGLGYLFKPQWIVLLNNWIRSTLANDAHVLLHGRRIGVVLLFIAFLCLTISTHRPVP